MLKPGQTAPSFTLPDQDGQELNLADINENSYVVLYFYPKDDTSGCTLEASQFSALADEFANLDTVVIGVSRDSCESHRQFIDKYQLRVALVSDSSGELCARYGVWQEKEKNGVKKMGIVRSTFIIDKQGRLADIEYGVNPDGHAHAVMRKIAGLSHGQR